MKRYVFAATFPVALWLGAISVSAQNFTDDARRTAESAPIIPVQPTKAAVSNAEQVGKPASEAKPASPAARGARTAPALRKVGPAAKPLPTAETTTGAKPASKLGPKEKPQQPQQAAARKQPIPAAKKPAVGVKQPFAAAKKPAVGVKQPFAAAKKQAAAIKPAVAAAAKQTLAAPNKPAVEQKPPLTASKTSTENQQLGSLKKPVAGEVPPSVAEKKPVVAGNKETVSAGKQPPTEPKQPIIEAKPPTAAATLTVRATEKGGGELPAFVYLEQGRRALLAGRNFEAALFLGKAYQQGVGEPLALEWLGDAMRRVASLESSVVEQQTDLTLVQFLSAGQRILTLSRFGSLALWDGSTGRRIPQPAVPSNPIVDAGISPDGARFFSIDNRHQVQVWDAELGTMVANLPAVDVSVARQSADGRRLLTVGRGDGPNDSIQLWDMQTGKIMAELRGREVEGTTDVKFSPGGRYVMIERTEAIHKIRIWDTVESRLKLLEEGQKAQFSSDGHRVAVFGAGTRPQLFDLSSGKNYAELRYQRTTVVDALFLLEGRRTLTMHKASDGSDGPTQVACLWDVNEGSFVALLSEKRGNIIRVVPSPDGKAVVTLNDEGTVSVWDGENGRKIATLDDDDENEQDNTQILFSQGSRLLLVRNPTSLGVFDAQTGRRIPLSGPVGALKQALFSPSGLYLATVGTDNAVRFWVAATGQPVGLINQGGLGVTDARFSPESAYFGILDVKGQITVWDITESRPRFTTTVPSTAHSFSFGNDVRYLSFAEPENRVSIRKVEPGTKAVPLRLLSETASGHTVLPLAMKKPRDVAFSSDGKKLLVRDEAQTYLVWELRSGRTLVRLQGHAQGIEDAPFSPDGRALIVVHTDGKTRLHDTQTGKVLAEVPQGKFAFSPVGGKLAIGEKRGRVTVWDLARGRMLSQNAGLGGEIVHLAWMPDAKRLAVASDLPLVRMLDANTGRTVAEHRNLPANVLAVGVSPDSKYVVAALPPTPKMPGSIKVFPFDGSEPTLLQQGKTSTMPIMFAFSRDGKRLFIEAQGKSRWLRPLPTGEAIAEQLGGVFAWSDESNRIFSAPTEMPAIVLDSQTGKKVWDLPSTMQDFQRVVFGPGGTHLLSVHTDDAVRVFETATGRLVLSLAKPQSPLRDAVLSPDGKRLFTIHDDDAIRQWHIETGKLVAELKGLAGARIVVSPDGGMLFSSDDAARHIVWDIRSEQRPSTEVSKWLACYLPYRLDGQNMVHRPTKTTDCK